MTAKSSAKHRQPSSLPLFALLPLASLIVSLPASAVPVSDRFGEAVFIDGGSAAVKPAVSSWERDVTGATSRPASELTGIYASNGTDEFPVYPPSGRVSATAGHMTVVTTGGTMNATAWMGEGMAHSTGFQANNVLDTSLAADSVTVTAVSGKSAGLYGGAVSAAGIHIDTGEDFPGSPGRQPQAGSADVRVGDVTVSSRLVKALSWARAEASGIHLDNLKRAAVKAGSINVTAASDSTAVIVEDAFHAANVGTLTLAADSISATAGATGSDQQVSTAEAAGLHLSNVGADGIADIRVESVSATASQAKNLAAAKAFYAEEGTRARVASQQGDLTISAEMPDSDAGIREKEGIAVAVVTGSSVNLSAPAGNSIALTGSVSVGDGSALELSNDTVVKASAGTDNNSVTVTGSRLLANGNVTAGELSAGNAVLQLYRVPSEFVPMTPTEQLTEATALGGYHRVTLSRTAGFEGDNTLVMRSDIRTGQSDRIVSGQTGIIGKSATFKFDVFDQGMRTGIGSLPADTLLYPKGAVLVQNVTPVAKENISTATKSWDNGVFSYTYSQAGGLTVEYVDDGSGTAGNLVLTSLGTPVVQVSSAPKTAHDANRAAATFLTDDGLIEKRRDALMRDENTLGGWAAIRHSESDISGYNHIGMHQNRLAFGYDGRLSERISAGLGVEMADADAGYRKGSGDQKAVLLGAYARYTAGSHVADVLFKAGRVRSDIDFTAGMIPRKYDNDFDGNIVSLEAGYGYRSLFDCGAYLLPQVRFRAAHLTSDSWSEQLADTKMRVKNEGVDSLRWSASLEAGYRPADNVFFFVKPSVFYEMDGDVETRIKADRRTLKMKDSPDGLGFGISAGLDAAVTKNVRAYAEIEATTMKEEQRNVSANAGVRIAF